MCLGRFCYVAFYQPLYTCGDRRHVQPKFKSFSPIMARSPRVKATVGPFTFAYPHLTAPDTEGKFADNKYKVDGIAPPTSDAMKRAKSVVAAAIKELGAPKGAMLPLKAETAKNDKTGKREPTENLMFRAKSQYAPAIVDSKGTPISDAVLSKLTIGAGSEGLLQGYFQEYEMKGEPGISFTLTGIMLTKLVKGGKGTADFGDFVGAYGGDGFTVDGDDEIDSGEGLDLGLDDEDPGIDEGDAGFLDI